MRGRIEMPSMTRRSAVVGLASSLAITPSLGRAQSAPLAARDVFSWIKAASEQPWDPNPTDDRVIYGNRVVPVSGIATCFFASLAVLRQAREAGLNYIIPHEASFYERYDDFAESALADTDPVIMAKKKFIDESRMVIQRMHSHAHSRPGDAIMTGLLERLGWKQIRREGNSPIVQLPATTAEDLGRHIGNAHIRLCGQRHERNG
jgi:hypothetical protein